MNGGWRLRRVEYRVPNLDGAEIRAEALRLVNAWGHEFVHERGGCRSAAMRFDTHMRAIGEPEKATLFEEVWCSAVASVIGYTLVRRPGESEPRPEPFNREAFDPMALLADVVDRARRWERETGHDERCATCSAARLHRGGRAFA